MGVDLFLAAEFHNNTTHTRQGMTPVQVVHGGRRLHASWLVIDEYEDTSSSLSRLHTVGVWATTPSG